MADDNRFRSTRPGDSFRRAAEPSRSSGHASDPLAELARLIGKNDPYAEFGLRDASSGEPQEGYSSAVPRQEDRHRAPSHEQYQEPYQGSELARGRDSYDAHRDGYRAYESVPPVHDARREDWGADGQPVYVEPQFEADPHAPAYADARSHHEGDGHEADHHLEDGASFDPSAEQMYDDAPRARRRGGLATALALIGCAMLGTAGAYAYRSYYGPSAPSQPPPVITADNSTPSKIIPARASDPQSGKIIQDRLANAGKEQIVSKQEEPVALKDLGTQAAPRVVLPAPVAPAPAASPQAPGGSGAAGSNEPKKVRTVTIRPDGTDASGRPGGAPSPVAQATGQAGGAAASRGGGAVPAARGSGGPLSLDPQAGEPAAAPAVRTRAATGPAATRPGSESAGNPSGGILVQLSSQKSEAEASSSFRSLQAKFPNELAGRNPIIRRADLGAKGVFYRTMVGPFASAQDANQFCTSFKAAGGHCVVPSN
jgi:hypothetical protein